jgi:hypothetical protein
MAVPCPAFTGSQLLGDLMLRNIARVCPILILSALITAPAWGDETVDLTPRYQPGQTMRVSIDFQAGGNALVRVAANGDPSGATGSTGANPAPGATAAPNAETQLPVSVAATLQYDERLLAPSRSGATGSASASAGLGATGSASAPGTPLAVRYYNQAEATIKVDKGGVAPRLADTRRTIVVEQAPTRPMLYSPAGPIPREELDLVDVLGNSTVLDQLLPTKPVAQGDSWPSDPNTMAALLTFDTVSVCEMQSVLEEFNASFAKIRVAGVVHGTADGTPTEQEIRAVALFDRRLGRIARLNIATREKRSIGAATPGLDAVAKLQIKLEPAPADTKLTDAAIAAATRTRRPANDVLLEVPGMGIRLVHDRQWYLTAQNRQSVTLRRLVQGEVVGQCTINALPQKSPGQQGPLEQFQRDVVQSLGPNFGEMVSAGQWLTARRHYCYGVIARGAVQEVPIEWHHYLLANDTGHRVSVAVTIQGGQAERLAQADRAVVEALELFPPVQTPVQASAPTPTTK